MLAWDRARGVAQLLWMMMLALSAGLPFGAALGQPGLVVADASPTLPDPALAPTTAIQPVRQTPEPFGLPSSNEASSFYAAKWRGVAGALDLDREILARCRVDPDRCPPAAQRFLAIVAGAQAKEGRARLGDINRALNLAVRYESDLIQHGEADAWAPPLATLSSGRGDCEDYAIAKYLALRETGMPADDLRLVVVRNTKLREHHAVLAARIEDRWLLLDNRRLLLLEDHEARDYVAATAFGPDAGPALVAAEPMESLPPVAADAPQN